MVSTLLYSGIVFGILILGFTISMLLFLEIFRDSEVKSAAGCSEMEIYPINIEKVQEKVI
jgi:hypothetical protein